MLWVLIKRKIKLKCYPQAYKNQIYVHAHTHLRLHYNNNIIIIVDLCEQFNFN